MSPKLVVFLLLCFIVVNLFIGLFRIMRGGAGADKSRVVRSLTIRVAASILLFAFILVLLYLTSAQS